MADKIEPWLNKWSYGRYRSTFDRHCMICETKIPAGAEYFYGAAPPPPVARVPSPVTRVCSKCHELSPEAFALSMRLAVSTK